MSPTETIPRLTGVTGRVIRPNDPKLADHLKHRLQRGNTLVYSPENGTRWET